jgi:hypothetical protein
MKPHRLIYRNAFEGGGPRPKSEALKSESKEVTQDRLELLALSERVEAGPQPSKSFDKIKEVELQDVLETQDAIRAAYAYIQTNIKKPLEDEIAAINVKIRAERTQEKRTELVNQRYYPKSGLKTLEKLIANPIPENKLLALVAKESRFKADAKSGSGAQGLFQIMGSAKNEAKDYFNYTAEDVNDPTQNAILGILYLGRCRYHYAEKIAPELEEKEQDDLSNAIYNAGPRIVKKLWRMIEPTSYSDFEQQLSKALCEQLGADDSNKLVVEKSYGVRYIEYGGIRAYLDASSEELKQTFEWKGEKVEGISVVKVGEMLSYAQIISHMENLEAPEPLYGPPASSTL